MCASYPRFLSPALLAKLRFRPLVALTLIVPASMVLSAGFGLVATSHAATIAVTTTDDVIAVDGLCSLREAVTAANTNAAFSDCPQGEAPPAVDVIELPAGTYSLTLAPIGEDNNLGGDLDITEQVTLRGLGDDFKWWDDPETPELEALDVYNDPDGFPRTFSDADLPAVIIENGLGKPTTPGDGDRVIHIDPLLDDPRPIFTFENLAIAHGDAFCIGQGCEAGAAGLFVSENTSEATSDLVLRRVTLFRNRLSCSGVACGQAANSAALRVDNAGAITIEESVIAGHHVACADSQCIAGRTIFIEKLVPEVAGLSVAETLITGNTMTCSATDCRVCEMISSRSNQQAFSQLVITVNDINCSAGGFDCDTDELVELLGLDSMPDLCVDDTCSSTWADVEISNNVLTCSGANCATEEIYESSDIFLQQRFERIRIQDNEQSCFGLQCSNEEIMDIDANNSAGASLTFTDVEALDNLQFCMGTDCDVDEVLDAQGDNHATIENLTIRSENVCIGDRCSVDELVDIDSFVSVSELEIRDSLISCTGEDCGTNNFFAPSNSDQLMTISALTIENSQSICSGTGCDEEFNSPGSGGMVRVSAGSGSVRFIDATITGNLTSLQGAVSVSGPVTFETSTISGNESTTNGGGINNATSDPGQLVLDRTVVDGNVAAGNGGGIYNPAGSTLTVIGGSIAGNSAVDGGGIYNEGTISFAGAVPFSANTPNDCVDAGAGVGCLDFLFVDGFETGDTSVWSVTMP